MREFTVQLFFTRITARYFVYRTHLRSCFSSLRDRGEIIYLAMRARKKKEHLRKTDGRSSSALVRGERVCVIPHGGGGGRGRNKSRITRAPVVR